MKLQLRLAELVECRCAACGEAAVKGLMHLCHAQPPQQQCADARELFGRGEDSDRLASGLLAMQLQPGPNTKALSLLLLSQAVAHTPALHATSRVAGVRSGAVLVLGKVVELLQSVEHNPLGGYPSLMPCGCC